MLELTGKKLLVLGGRTVGSYEIVKMSKEKGVHTIVTDYLSEEQSVAKSIADEVWNISTADVDVLAEAVKQNHVDGVIAGVNEFNIKKAIALCEKTGLHFYCNTAQWDMLQNKEYFKKLCREYHIPVTKEYKINSVDDIEKLESNIFPVITKPVDGSGSRGFSICNNIQELKRGYAKACSVSATGNALVEKYMDYKNSVIINYTVVNGMIYYCGMSDKQSKKVMESGAPCMSIQFYPSIDEKKYLYSINEKVEKMLSRLGLRQGAIWIEAFNDNGNFTFNEVGFRFGGSLTYFPVEYFYGINQLELQIEYVLCGKNDNNVIFQRRDNEENIYCIFPVHVKTGIIKKVEGLEELLSLDKVKKIVQVHYVGEKIEEWGSAQQVFAYIHFVAEAREQVDEIVSRIIETIRVYDEDNNSLLFNLYME